VAALLVCALPAQAERPEINYQLQCQGCHLADGSGKPGSVPSFVDEVGRYLSLPRGREYLIRVPGASQAPIDDAELAALLNWIIERFGPADVAPRFEHFRPAEVARWRRPPLDQPERLRAELRAAMAQRASPGKPAKNTGSSARRSGER
jgi:hypothetical protein